MKDAKKNYDKSLKRVRERFHSPKTLRMLTDALAENTKITVFDSRCIIDRLFEHKDRFKTIEDVHSCRTAMVAWAVRQGVLIIKLREMLSELKLHGHVATLVHIRLPEYEGTYE